MLQAQVMEMTYDEKIAKEVGAAINRNPSRVNHILCDIYKHLNVGGKVGMVKKIALELK